MRAEPSERGAASVEHVALATLLALLVAAAVAAIAGAPPLGAGRELGATIGRKIACAPRLPDPCNRQPPGGRSAFRWASWFATSPPRRSPPWAPAARGWSRWTSGIAAGRAARCPA